MSRIGKKPVSYPGNVKVNVTPDGKVTVEGPKGTLSMTARSEVSVEVDSGAKSVAVTIPQDKYEDRVSKALWGTTRALIACMVKGVSEGYQKQLKIEGVGWNAQLQGQQLRLVVGYANPRFVDIPMGVNVAVEKNLVTVTGADKQAVGQFAAKVRAVRKPEPYNGKGIMYAGEVIRRKAGKAFGS